VLERFLHWMGLGLCHQIPERSFFGGGVQVPVCARDTGIYVGFALAFALLAVIHRSERTRGFPRRPAWIVMGLYFAAMAWDGVSSYAGLRETTNDLRLLTGLGVGLTAATVIYPMLQDELWHSAGSGRLLDPRWRFWVWLASMPVAFVAIRWGAPLLGLGYPVLVAICIVFALAAVNLVIVAMLPMFDRRARRFRQLWLPVLLATALAFAEIAATSGLRAILERLT